MPDKSKSKLCPVVTRVRYSETDRMGLVYHVNYLEYFELARSAWIRLFWKPYRSLEDEGYALVVIEAHIHYARPAYYDDLLVLTAVPVEFGKSRIIFDYNVCHPGEDDPVCTGRTSHCFIDRDTGKPIPMPGELHRRLVSFMKQS